MKAPGPGFPARRNRHWLRALAIFLVPSVLSVTFVLKSSHRAPEPRRDPVDALAPNWQAAIDTSAPAANSRRPIYPYSVIPGGVRDGRELSTAVAKDPVVAEHYSDFKASSARTVRLDRPTAMYVSYRVNDHVYWTRNRMLIPAGETLISDGKNLARVRCGNRLSAIAAKPVSQSEPPAEKLEAPAFIPPLLADLMPGEGADGFAAPELGAPPMPILPPSANGSAPDAASFPPILIPGSKGPKGSTSGSPSGPGSGPPTGSPTGPRSGPPSGPPSGPAGPPVSAPEPVTWQLLLAGAFLFAAIAALFRKTATDLG